MRMINETEPAPQSPAAVLESDLADIRALLRQAVAISSNVNKAAETRIAAMTAATRLFSAATKGSEIIARLSGHVSQTRHTTVVHNEMIGPDDGQSYDEWWNSLSPGTQAELDRRFNEPWRKMRPALIAEREERQEADRAADMAYVEATLQRLAAEGGDPSEENPKTTSAACDVLGSDDLDDCENPEEA
jgi:hypothetical protein